LPKLSQISGDKMDEINDLKNRVLRLEATNSELVQVLLTCTQAINHILDAQDIHYASYKVTRYYVDELVNDFNMRKVRKQTDMLN
jgi:hypothetical protein